MFARMCVFCFVIFHFIGFLILSLISVFLFFFRKGQRKYSWVFREIERSEMEKEHDQNIVNENILNKNLKKNPQRLAWHVTYVRNLVCFMCWPDAQNDAWKLYTEPL